ncbi:MAG TPA: calcium/proton exchanger [Candidatus Tectomicrobia bacterium]|nr:calcium/proton exchanger [Candidatus Tectomicrobia bacterium]
MASGTLAAGLKPSLSWLLVFVPVSVYLEHFHPQAHLWIFFAACVAIIPLAGLLGEATEHIAERAGEGIGGLLNATFGNAAELIIAIVALRAGYIDVVKASLTGSIIGNILLVLGAAFLAGGVYHKIQQFNPISGRTQAAMLVLASIALIIPALFHHLRPAGIVINEAALSLAIAALLIIVYALSLVFSLHTHKELFRGSGAEPSGQEMPASQPWSGGGALLVLGVSTFFIAWMSEVLVGSVEQAAEAVGMSKIFVGIIVVAIVGNAAEHSTAVMVAIKNRMDLSYGIAIGSSTQIALFVAPLLVFLSYLMAPQPMDLVFTRGEVLAVILSTFMVAFAAGDGRSNWFMGAQLLVVYLILAVAFYFTPG